MLDKPTSTTMYRFGYKGRNAEAGVTIYAASHGLFDEIRVVFPAYYWLGQVPPPSVGIALEVWGWPDRLPETEIGEAEDEGEEELAVKQVRITAERVLRTRGSGRFGSRAHLQAMAQAYLDQTEEQV